MLSKGDIYTNQCNEQRISYTITSVEGDMLTVYSSNLNRTYVLHHLIFRDTMRALGFTLQSDKYRLFHPKYQALYADSFESFNQAMSKGKQLGYDFQIEFGSMICATWDHETDQLRFTQEYKRWYQENERLVDEPAKYRIYFINHQMYHANSYEGINSAIEAGKAAGFEFRIELGEMVCAAWSPIGGLRFFSEYQRWAQDQQYKLAQIQGEV